MRLHYIAAVLCAVLAALAAAVLGQGPQVALTGPRLAQLADGRSYEIKWSSAQDIRSVSVAAEGDRISLPDKPRGQFVEVIAEGVDAGRGGVSWTVPFLDTLRFRIKVKGYDATGKLVAEDSRSYIFRPEVLRTRTADGIYIDLRSAERQRLYRLHGNVVTHAYLTSGARTHEFLPKTADRAKPHDHVGVFRVTDRYPMYWSRTYKVWMTHSMRLWKGHFVHGTYPDQYYLLGRPASSGCVRLHRTDAKELYSTTPAGTRVEIFGNLSK